MIVKRKQIYTANLDPATGSEQGGERPVIILQNNIGNLYSPTVVVAPVTSKLEKHRLPTHVLLRNNVLERYSIALLEQIKTIDKSRLIEYIGIVTDEEMAKIEQALLISAGMKEGYTV